MYSCITNIKQCLSKKYFLLYRIYVLLFLFCINMLSIRKFHLVFSSNITFNQVHGPAVTRYFDIDLQIDLLLIIMYINVHWFIFLQ